MLFPVAHGPPATAQARSREQLTLACLPRTLAHPLPSFCCRSKTRTPHKDSPAANTGQERPGDLFPESLLTGTQKNKVI